ncbi:MAG: hypothetical protein IJ724_01870 [Muribaculaceae bacterium]|nr:hypothetical protein [Muribaculaceae bacterium]
MAALLMANYCMGMIGIEATVSSETKDSILVSLRNSTDDTVYLFDSYIKEYSRYLLHYNPESRRQTLCLLPLAPYIAIGMPNDCIVLGEKRVKTFASIAFHLESIPPKSKKTFCIAKKLFYNRYCVDDICPQEFMICDSIPFSEKNTGPVETRYIELAIYNKQFRLEEFTLNDWQNYIHSYEKITIELNAASELIHGQQLIFLGCDLLNNDLKALELNWFQTITTNSPTRNNISPYIDSEDHRFYLTEDNKQELESYGWTNRHYHDFYFKDMPGRPKTESYFWNANLSLVSQVVNVAELQNISLEYGYSVDNGLITLSPLKFQFTNRSINHKLFKIVL